MSEEATQKMGKIDDILNIISRTNETFIYDIYVPSLKQDVPFREITTSQQERLLKAIIDSPAYNTEFIFALRSIIKENCVNPEIDIGAFTIFDKMVIAIRMRSMSISNDLDLQFKVPNSDKKIVRRINLDDLVKVALSEISVSPLTIEHDNTFQVICDLPTINDEYNLEKELRKNVETIQIKNEKELRETIGQVYTNEIVKYIRQINITTNDGIVELDLKNMKYKDRLSILAKLPAKLNNKIVDYIDTINKEFQKVTLFKEEVEGKTIEQRLKIDASFFTHS